MHSLICDICGSQKMIYTELQYPKITIVWLNSGPCIHKHANKDTQTCKYLECLSLISYPKLLEMGFVFPNPHLPLRYRLSNDRVSLQTTVMSKCVSADHNQMQHIMYEKSFYGTRGPTYSRVLHIGMEAAAYRYIVNTGAAYQVVLGWHMLWSV